MRTRQLSFTAAAVLLLSFAPLAAQCPRPDDLNARCRIAADFKLPRGLAYFLGVATEVYECDSESADFILMEKRHIYATSNELARLPSLALALGLTEFMRSDSEVVDTMRKLVHATVHGSPSVQLLDLPTKASELYAEFLLGSAMRYFGFRYPLGRSVPGIRFYDPVVYGTISERAAMFSAGLATDAARPATVNDQAVLLASRYTKCGSIQLIAEEATKGFTNLMLSKPQLSQVRVASKVALPGAKEDCSIVAFSGRSYLTCVVSTKSSLGNSELSDWIQPCAGEHWSIRSGNRDTNVQTVFVSLFDGGPEVRFDAEHEGVHDTRMTVGEYRKPKLPLLTEPEPASTRQDTPSPAVAPPEPMKPGKPLKPATEAALTRAAAELSNTAKTLGCVNNTCAVGQVIDAIRAAERNVLDALREGGYGALEEFAATRIAEATAALPRSEMAYLARNVAVTLLNGARDAISQVISPATSTITLQVELSPGSAVLAIWPKRYEAGGKESLRSKTTVVLYRGKYSYVMNDAKGAVLVMSKGDEHLNLIDAVGNSLYCDGNATIVACGVR